MISTILINCLSLGSFAHYVEEQQRKRNMIDLVLLLRFIRHEKGDAHLKETHDWSQPIVAQQIINGKLITGKLTR